MKSVNFGHDHGELMFLKLETQILIVHKDSEQIVGTLKYETMWDSEQDEYGNEQPHKDGHFYIRFDPENPEAADNIHTVWLK